MVLTELASETESTEKEVEGERMKEEEFNNQRSRFGRLMSFNNQLYIGPLTDEINAFESMWRYSLQRQKCLEKMLSESYAKNRNIRERLDTVSEMMGSPPVSQSATR